MKKIFFALIIIFFFSGCVQEFPLEVGSSTEIEIEYRIISGPGEYNKYLIIRNDGSVDVSGTQNVTQTDGLIVEPLNYRYFGSITRNELEELTQFIIDSDFFDSDFFDALIGPEAPIDVIKVKINGKTKTVRVALTQNSNPKIFLVKIKLTDLMNKIIEEGKNKRR